MTDLDHDRAAQIAYWTRKYAQNRTLTIIVALLLTFGTFGALNLFVPLAREAWREQRWIMFGFSFGIVMLSAVMLIWISVPRWGGEAMRRLGESAYGTEGRVLVETPPGPRYQRRLGWAAVAVFACVQATVILAGKGYIPGHLLQPVSALYAVPFMLLMGRLNPNGAGMVQYAWPALYAVHALLIVAGAPIVFTGEWEPLNILVPVCGYGLITALAAHIYSRHALRKLREVAR